MVFREIEGVVSLEDLFVAGIVVPRVVCMSAAPVVLLYSYLERKIALLAYNVMFPTLGLATPIWINKTTQSTVKVILK